MTTPELLIYETDHIIALNISIDEGAVFHFGRLLMDGVERHAGDAATLTQSWNSLSGVRFDSRLLDRWLSENQFACPRCTRSRNIDIEATGREQGIADVHLSLPSVP